MASNIDSNKYQPIPQDNVVIDIPEEAKTLPIPRDKPGDFSSDPSYTTDKGVNLKRVAVITLAVIGATAAAAAIAATVLAVLGVTVLATVGIPVIPMIIVASVTGGVALAVIGVGLWERITPLLPEKLRIAANWVQTIVTETFGVIALGVMFPFNSTWFDPKKKEDCDPNQTPILMIHGFMGSGNNWEYHRHLLHKNGHKNVFTVNLGSPFKSISAEPEKPGESYAEAVEKKVAEIKRLTGRDDLIIVGHSMGGLVGKQYIYNHAEKQGVKVLGEISMGTPHNGTKMAKLVSKMFTPAEQMEYGSEFVKGLQEKARDDQQCKYYHVAAKPDLVIFPQTSAHHSEACLREEHWLDATGHVGYLFSHTAGVHMLDAVKKLKEETSTAAAAAA